MYFRAGIFVALLTIAPHLYAQSEAPSGGSTTPLQIFDETTILNEVDSSTVRQSTDDINDSIVSFAANPDDLEDVVQDQSATSFNGLQLEEASTTKKAISTNNDLRNVYKVTRIKAAETIIKSKLDSSKSERFPTFEVYKQLFDQSQWSWDAISKVLKGQCAKDMQMFLEGLAVEEEWALQASDQSGRYRGMFFYGNEYWVGNQGFCREINRQRSFLSVSEQIKQPAMQFFMGTFKVKLPIFNDSHLQLGQCLPVSCTIQDVHNILEQDTVSRVLIESGSSDINLLAVRTVPGPYGLWKDSRFHILLGIVILCAICMFIGTVYEMTTKKRVIQTAMGIPNLVNSINNNNNNNGNIAVLNGHTNKGFVGKQLELHDTHMHQHIELQNGTSVINNGVDQHMNAKPQVVVPVVVKLSMFHRVVLCFGLISNSKAIISSKKLPDESVSCIHGMRVFSMLWTIMVHTYLQTFGISENKFNRTITERHFWFQVIGNATYSVDTFFFLSGLLVTLLFLRSEEQNVKKNRPKATAALEVRKTILLFVYRYIRLTPVYFVALLCSELSLKYIYNASAFQPGLTDHAVCPDFWWRNVLYIQNWFPFPQLCMIWSWYLANDMQFYVWAVIMLVIANKYFKTSATLIIGFLLSSWVISATVSLSWNYQLQISEPLDSFGFLYDKPWTRIGPYIMGMIAGLLIFRFKEPPKITQPFNMFMWAVSMATMFLIIFGNWNGKMSVVDTAFFVSLSHTGWGFALIWITLSCRWGLARPVNTFLSYPGFLPLSRLTYCTYLIHPVTQIVTAFSMQGPFHLDHLMALTVFLGSAVVSYICAFILSVLCEAPIVRIMRIFFAK